MSIVEALREARNKLAMDQQRSSSPIMFVSASQMEIIKLETEWAKLPKHQAHMKRLKYFLKKKLTRKRKLLPLPQ